MTPAQLDEWVAKFAEGVIREKANSEDEHIEPCVFPFRLSDADRGQMKDMGIMPVGSLMLKSKELCRIIVHKTLNAVEADGYLFMAEGWMSALLEGESVEDAKDMVPSERPNRMSMLKVSGRLRTGYGVSYICEGSNLTGERFTRPFHKADGEGTGPLSNFFDKEPADVFTDT